MGEGGGPTGPDGRMSDRDKATLLIVCAVLVMIWVGSEFIKWAA